MCVFAGTVTEEGKTRLALLLFRSTVTFAVGMGLICTVHVRFSEPNIVVWLQVRKFGTEEAAEDARAAPSMVDRVMKRVRVIAILFRMIVP